jgi:putative membrane protein
MNWLISEWKNLQKSEQFGIAALACFYCFGAIGINFYLTRNIFEALSSFTLAYSFLLLLHYHQPKTLGFWIAVAFAFSFGMTAEIIGVKTGKLFGRYEYTSTLGISIFSVPLVIGMNWVSLMLACNTLMQAICKSKIMAAVCAAFSMVCFDIMIEPLAIRHRYWIWLDNGFPPIQNFVAWFAISLILSLIFQLVVKSKINMQTIAFLVLLWMFLWLDFCITFFEQQFHK